MWCLWTVHVCKLLLIAASFFGDSARRRASSWCPHLDGGAPVACGIAEFQHAANDTFHAAAEWVRTLGSAPGLEPVGVPTAQVDSPSLPTPTQDPVSSFGGVLSRSPQMASALVASHSHQPIAIEWPGARATNVSLDDCAAPTPASSDCVTLTPTPTSDYCEVLSPSDRVSDRASIYVVANASSPIRSNLSDRADLEIGVFESPFFAHDLSWRAPRTRLQSPILPLYFVLADDAQSHSTNAVTLGPLLTPRCDSNSSNALVVHTHPLEREVLLDIASIISELIDEFSSDLHAGLSNLTRFHISPLASAATEIHIDQLMDRVGALSANISRISNNVLAAYGDFFAFLHKVIAFSVTAALPCDDACSAVIGRLSASYASTCEYVDTIVKSMSDSRVSSYLSEGMSRLQELDASLVSAYLKSCGVLFRAVRDLIASPTQFSRSVFARLPHAMSTAVGVACDCSSLAVASAFEFVSASWSIFVWAVSTLVSPISACVSACAAGVVSSAFLLRQIASDVHVGIVSCVFEYLHVAEENSVSISGVLAIVFFAGLAAKNLKTMADHIRKIGACRLVVYLFVKR